MIMVTYPPALRRTGFVAPRAIGRLGAAVMEARAAESAPSPAPPPAVRPTSAQTPAPARHVVRLWLPSTVLFLLLAPFALLLALIASPFCLFAPRAYAIRPIVSILAVGRVLVSMSGTDVDIETRDALVRIRLF